MIRITFDRFPSDRPGGLAFGIWVWPRGPVTYLAIGFWRWQINVRGHGFTGHIHR